MAANAMRENAPKNNLSRARDAVRRFPELKALCRKFIGTYEKRTEAPDPKHGFKKYKALLQKAANQRLETIFVDLNDLEDFCKQEILEPDEAIADAKGIPKIQLQQSIEKWISDIETNASRYMKYFYEACDAELPERDADFNTDGSLAKDVITRWREATLRRQGGENSLPLRLKNDFDVRFKPRDGCKTLRMRELTAGAVGALVQLDCMVVRTSQVKPRVEVVAYHCDVCHAEIFHTVEGERYTPFKECPAQKCKDNKQSGKLRQNARTSKFGKYQEIRVTEMSEHVPVGGVPRSMKVILTGDIARTVLPGDAITLTGVYKPSELPWLQARSRGTMQEMYVDAHSIKKHKSGYNEQDQNEEEVARQVEEAHRNGNLYENAARSIAPEIFGHTDVKKALLLVLIGSFTKTMKDGMKIRGDIHTLFMGDPGVAKSQLLKQVCNIAPRSVYTTGKGSSGVGLTAAVTRDNATGEVSLEGGALVLADMGICCIDEFDKMDENDRTAIHEVMEQQSVSLAKAGITTTLNSRTTVLAAANPKYGRYDIMKSPVENIDLPPALLSRFDLLFLLLDTFDAEKDKNLALHVCKVHSTFSKGDADKKEETATDEVYEFKAFDASFMRNYVRKAKSFEPLIDDDLMQDIVAAYVAMREEENIGEKDSRKSYTTPRTLLAILRLSQAHARARFSERVEREDFDEAIRLMKASKESVEIVAGAKKGTNPLDLVYDIIADLSRKSADSDGWVDMTYVVNTASLKALTQDMVEEAIENWESLSVVVRNPEKTKVRFMVPVA
mmetsp:Transcript_44033/g.128215  ORF Transcript_44033/g.128215 Transcript_44033/m.128215 type:complete len:786 (+) Transcript_44033:97-2454(+)